MVEPEIWCFLMRVYVDSLEFFRVSQNGVYTITTLTSLIHLQCKFLLQT